MCEPVLLCSEQFSTCNNVVLTTGRNCGTELYPVISELVMLQYPDTPEIEKPHVEDWHPLARVSFRIRKPMKLQVHKKIATFNQYRGMTEVSRKEINEGRLH